MSTKWNSQHALGSAVRGCHPPCAVLRGVPDYEVAGEESVISLGFLQSYPHQAGVKLNLAAVELLRKVIAVLDPFYRVTLQLSRDYACISEVAFCSVHPLVGPVQVVPIVTQIKEDLAKISEYDNGVKGFKKKLLTGVEDRLGWFEGETLYGSSCTVDPRSNIWNALL